jgi:hypothetical protein
MSAAPAGQGEAAQPSSAAARPFEGGGAVILLALLAGAIGATLFVIGLLRDGRQALISYLIAYAYLVTIVLGALAFVLSMHAAGAVWPTAVRRFAEGMTAVLPLGLVLAAPLFIGAGLIYPWVHPERIASSEAREVVLHKHAYLNLPFTAVRAAAYFAFFIGVARTLTRWSLRMDRPEAPATLAALKRRMRVLGSVALPGLGVFGTMASWDWLMSLSPSWYSTIFGLYYLSGGFVAALAAISLCAVLARRAGYLPELGPSHFYALGRMMLAFLVFWAYTAYFQYMLSWEANRPTEAAWFVARTVGGYGRVGLFLIFGAFGLPFLILLSYPVKRRAWGIGAVAVWILGSQYFAVHWIVAAARGTANAFAWTDLSAMLGVGGFALAFGVWRQRGRLLAPVHDPAFVRALEYTSK